MTETASGITGENVLPFYIVCDESGSMQHNGGITAINDGLPDLHSAIASDPLVSDKCRVGLIAFSDSADVLMPLSRISDVADMPGMSSKGLTSYSAAFELLKSEISTDISSLKSQGYQVFRPAVFFISDGEPTDDWQSAHSSLVNGNPQAPNIISFGVADADESIMSSVATVACFMADQAVNPGIALREILKSLTNSIVSSSSSSVPQLVLPPPPPGTRVVPLEQM